MLFSVFFVWVADRDQVMEILAAAIGSLCRRSDPGGYLCLHPNYWILSANLRTTKGRTLRYALFGRPVAKWLKVCLRGQCILGHDRGCELRGFKRFSIFHIASDTLIQFVPGFADRLQQLDHLIGDHDVV